MSRPWMPLYIADYLKDTTHLGALESGAYLHLIMNYWQHGKLPNDDRQLARIAKLTEKEWKQAKPVLAAFFGPEWESHKRVDAELAKSEEVSNKRRAAAEQRYSKRPAIADAIADANAHTVHTSQFTSEQASTSEQEPARALDDVSEARVAVVRAFGDANSPNLPDTSRVGLWKTQGYDLKICCAVVRDLVARKPSVSSLNYFDNAIREAHERRNPHPAEPAAEPDWASFVSGWSQGGIWPRALGPEPGYPGCRCPAEILEQHGIDPKTGMPKFLRREAS